MKNKKEVISQILTLPRKFKDPHNNKSFSILLEETGYFEILDQIQEGDIFECVKKNPEYTKDWMELSENKRVSSGWYFKKDGDRFTVSFLPKDEKPDHITTNDISCACSFFIKKEIESVQSS